MKVQEKPPKFFSQLFFWVWYGKLNLIIFWRWWKKCLRKYRHLLLPCFLLSKMIFLKWETKLLDLTSHKMPLIQSWYSIKHNTTVEHTYSSKGHCHFNTFCNPLNLRGRNTSYDGIATVLDWITKRVTRRLSNIEKCNISSVICYKIQFGSYQLFLPYTSSNDLFAWSPLLLSYLKFLHFLWQAKEKKINV